MPLCLCIEVKTDFFIFFVFCMLTHEVQTAVDIHRSVVNT